MALFCLFFSVLTRDQLHPHLKEYVERFGTKNYHGGPIEVDIIYKNVETITFYDDTYINGHHHEEITVSVYFAMMSL